MPLRVATFIPGLARSGPPGRGWVPVALALAAAGCTEPPRMPPGGGLDSLGTSDGAEPASDAAGLDAPTSGIGSSEDSSAFETSEPATSGTGASADETTETGASVGCDGDPVVAPAGEWSWVGVPGTRCADGSETGFAINPSDRGDRLLLFLMGGGGCFTAPECTGPCNPGYQHCAANLDGYDATTAGQELAMFGPGSIFDRGDPDNPFRDDDWVLVPYCTGDFHSGGAQAEYGTWHVGRENLQADLAHVVPTFCDASSVVLMGSSAGGFGAVFGYDLVAGSFAGIAVDLVDDSGPPLATDAMPLQDQMRGAWGSAEHAPPGCPGCATGWDAYLPWIAATYPDARISLVSSLADPSIGPYFGGPIADPGGFAAAMNAFADGPLSGLANVRVYYVAELHHVYASEDLGAVVSAGVPLATFLRQQLDDDPAWASVRP